MIALIAALSMLQENIDEFYKFPEGTTWTYESTRQGKHSSTLTIRVLKAEEGKVHAQYKEKRDGSGEDTMEMVWSAKDGFLLWELVNPDGKVEKKIQVLKAGAKKGDTWNGLEEEQICCEGIEKVKVPAGEYEAVHVKSSRGKKETASLYFAPKVGLVKGVEESETTELKEFSAAASGPDEVFARGKAAVKAKDYKAFYNLFDPKERETLTFNAVKSAGIISMQNKEWEKEWDSIAGTFGMKRGKEKHAVKEAKDPAAMFEAAINFVDKHGEQDMYYLVGNEALHDVAIDGDHAKGMMGHKEGKSGPIEFIKREGQWYFAVEH
jgi:hypothetical protein